MLAKPIYPLLLSHKEVYCTSPFRNTARRFTAPLELVFELVAVLLRNGSGGCIVHLQDCPSQLGLCFPGKTLEGLRHGPAQLCNRLLRCF